MSVTVPITACETDRVKARFERNQTRKTCRRDTAVQGERGRSAEGPEGAPGPGAYTVWRPRWGPLVSPHLSRGVWAHTAVDH